jgi:hypothetical protein
MAQSKPHGAAAALCIDSIGKPEEPPQVHSHKPARLTPTESYLTPLGRLTTTAFIKTEPDRQRQVSRPCI